MRPSLVLLRPLVALSLLAGCASSQTFTTARTLDEGQIQHTVGANFVGAHVDTEDCTEGEEGCLEDPMGFVPVPILQYGLRAGLTNNVELGVQLSVLGEISGDLKLALVHTPMIDIAIDPRITTGWFWAMAQLPILVSMNLGDSVTITVAPRASYFGLTVPDSDLSDSYLGGLFVGGTASVQLRVADNFAITPSIDYQRLVGLGDYSGDSGFGLLIAGVGLTFGAMPSYAPQ